MDRRALLLVLVTAGCRQIFGLDDLAPDAKRIDAPDQHADAPVDVLAPADCMTRWRTTPVFGAAMPLSTLNTASDEDHPFLSPDEKTIYFTRSSDIYVATRATLQDPFGTAAIDSSLSTVSNEGKAFVNYDGTRAFFASDQQGGQGGFDLWRGSRAAATGPFSVDRLYVGSLDDDKSQVDPHMSTDLLRLYFIPSAGPSQHIALATRANTSQDFQAATTFVELAGAGVDAGPTLTEDETVIVFSSTRGGGEHMYYATRMTGNAGFTMPKVVPQLGSTAIDAAPHVSRDGCHVYFMSTRNGSRDLFVATML